MDVGLNLVAAVANAIGCPNWTCSGCDGDECYCQQAAEGVAREMAAVIDLAASNGEIVAESRNARAADGTGSPPRSSAQPLRTVSSTAGPSIEQATI